MAFNLNRIIIVDVESTCWATKEGQGSRPNEVIEIGACELNTKTGAITNKQSILVRPQFGEVSDFCTELTGWTQADVVYAGVTMLEALSRFQAHFRPTKYDIWGSFGQYDKNMLSSTTEKGVKQYGIEADFNPFDRMQQHLNIKTLFALIHGTPKEVGMAKALELLNLKLEGRHHNGADDAVNIAKIFSHCIA